MTDQDETLLIIGGGPKAAAVCAKCRILRDLGRPAPLPIVFERYEPGAAWIGKYGYTTGHLLLGTAPEKDVGFPYAPDPPDGADKGMVTSGLYGKYSWNAYQTTKEKGIGDWIDRGRPHPTHHEWSKYIAWVIKESMSDRTNYIVNGTVKKILVANRRWKVVVEKRFARSEPEYEGEKLLITGTGDPKRPNFVPKKSDLIMFGDDFWVSRNLTKIDRLQFDEGDRSIVVLGGGESAASIAAYLAEKNLPITILTRSGTIFSRGEGYYENRIYTNVNEWENLPSATRRQIIRRTDRGVFSPGVIAKLAAALNVNHIFCDVKTIKVLKNGRRQETGIQISGTRAPLTCRLLMVAMGFDPLSFKRMIKDKKLLRALRSEEQVQKRIKFDLSVQLPKGYPKLYLPGLAAFSQGPGFPNLSCLGLLSDRILGRRQARKRKAGTTRISSKTPKTRDV